MKLCHFRITVKIRFPLDPQKHPETEKVNVYFPRILFHFFPFFSKETPLFSVADREALRGKACESAVTADGRGSVLYLLGIDRL